MHSPTETTGYRRLAAAVLRQAVRDAQSDNGTATEARAWLAESSGCADLCDLIGLDRGAVAAWVDGLPPVRQPALPGL